MYAVSSHTEAQVRAPQMWRHADSARPGWSVTRRRIGGSFTRTSQAFARFNPEIRTGAAELLEHSVRRPRPRVRRVVVNPLPHRTFAQESFAGQPSNPCPTQGVWRLLATLAEALYQRACVMLIPHSTHRIPQAERKRDDMGWEGVSKFQ